MNSETIKLATTLVHCTSIFGFITNSIAIITIRKCVDLQTSFGILCAFLAANNSLLLILYSTWYVLPDEGIFKAESNMSIIVGMVRFCDFVLNNGRFHIGGSLWIVGIRYHLLISVNRLVAIVYPVKRKKYVNSKTTTIAVMIIICSTILQCSPLIFVDDLWFCFDRSDMQWKYAPTHNGEMFEIYLIDLSNALEISLIFIIDLITLVHLRIYNSKNAITHNKSRSAKSRAVEIRLFKQAFSQIIPLLATLIIFASVTPRVSDDFTKFITTTFTWHLAHGLDGLIIDLFHTRMDLFLKKQVQNNSIKVDSSFALTSVA